MTLFRFSTVATQAALIATLAVAIVAPREAISQCTGWPVTCQGIHPGTGAPAGLSGLAGAVGAMWGEIIADALKSTDSDHEAAVKLNQTALHWFNDAKNNWNCEHKDRALRDLTLAINLQEKAIALWPEDDTIRANLALYHSKQNNHAPFICGRELTPPRRVSIDVTTGKPEPPSPPVAPVTYPSTFAELKERLSDSSGWVVDRFQAWVNEVDLPQATREKMRDIFNHWVIDHAKKALPEEGQVRLDIALPLIEDDNKVWNSLKRDLSRGLGHDAETQAAISEMIAHLRVNIGEELKKKLHLKRPM